MSTEHEVTCPTCGHKLDAERTRADEQGALDREPGSTNASPDPSPERPRWETEGRIIPIGYIPRGMKMRGGLIR